MLIKSYLFRESSGISKGEQPFKKMPLLENVRILPDAR